MIPRLIAGAIVIAPVFYTHARVTLGQFVMCILFACLAAACMPEEWHE